MSNRPTTQTSRFNTDDIQTNANGRGTETSSFPEPSAPSAGASVDTRSLIIDPSIMPGSRNTIPFMITNETPSIMMILDKKDSKIIAQTNKFLLQSITKPKQERFQIIETFGNSHVFFYGERTKVYTIQGILLDGFYKNESNASLSKKSLEAQYKNMWAAAFEDFYNTEFRGSILKDKNYIAGLYVNGWLIKGYPIQLTLMKESNQMPDAISFQMSWVIESDAIINSELAKLNYTITFGEELATAWNGYIKASNDYQSALNTYNSLNITETTKRDELNAKLKTLSTALRDAKEKFVKAQNKEKLAKQKKV